MAGPFSPINQPDIHTPGLQQTELAMSPAEAGGAAKAIVQGVAGVQEVRKELKKGQLRDDIEAVLAGLKLARGGGGGRGRSASKEAELAAEHELGNRLGGVVEGLRLFREGSEDSIKELEDAAASGNATAAAKLEEYRAIQRGVAEGKLPSDAAALRLRAITKSAINAAPEFAKDFRATARAALGFSPEAEVTRRLMREPTAGPKTAAQKQAEEFEAGIQEIIFMSGGSVDYNGAKTILQNRMMEEFQAQTARDRMAIGNFSARNMEAHQAAAGSAVLTDIIGDVQKQVIQSGGIADVGTMNLLVNNRVEQARAQALASAPNAEAAAQINAQYNQIRDNALKLVASASTGEQATQRLNTLTQLAASNFAMTYPELTPWMGLKNPEVLFDVINTSNKMANRPDVMKAFGYGGEASAQGIGEQTFNNLPVEFRNAMLKQYTGEERTPREKELTAYGNRETLKSQAEPEQKQQALSDLIETNGAFTAVTALDDARVMRSVLNDPVLTEQATNLLSTKLEAQSSRMRMMRNSVPGVTVSVEGGKLVVSGAPAGEFTGGQGPGLGAYNDLKRTAEQMNRLVDVNNRYAEASGKFSKYDISASIQDISIQDFEQTEFSVELGSVEAGTADGRYTMPDGRLIEVRGGVAYGTE